MRNTDTTVDSYLENQNYKLPIFFILFFIPVFYLLYKKMLSPYPSVIESKYTQIGPIFYLQRFARSISSNEIKKHIKDDKILCLAKWKGNVLALDPKQDRLSQFPIAYSQLLEFLSFLKKKEGFFSWLFNSGGVAFKDICQDNHLRFFLDMFYRDLNKEYSTIALSYLISPKMTRVTKVNNSITLPNTYPLRCLPVPEKFNNNKIYHATQLLPRGKYAVTVEKSNEKSKEFLPYNLFCNTISSTHCSSTCMTIDWSSVSIQACLLSNSLVRDRALYNLENFNNAIEQKIPPAALQEIEKLNLFAPNSPFIIMQNFIAALEHELKIRAGRQATILGDFQPIKNPKDYPIPLFKRKRDGNLLGFFWHGTNLKNSRSISNTSFMLNKAANNSLYGPGAYFAIESCKSLQYTDTVRSCLLFVAVFLGKYPYFQNKRGGCPNDDTNTIIAVPHYANSMKQVHWEFISTIESSIVPLLNITIFDKKEQKSPPSKQHKNFIPPTRCPIM